MNDISIANKARKMMLTYTGVLLALNILVQLIIVMRDNKIDVVSTLVLGVVYVYYLYFSYLNPNTKNTLNQLRFGRLIAHVVTFVIVNVSYHLHAFILIIANSDSIRGNKDFLMDPGWFGPLFGMLTFWGIGLLMHIIGSIISRGFEYKNG